MPRETMDREIRDLKDEIVLLGSMVEKNIADAMVSLKNRDVQLAREVLHRDQQVNQKDRKSVV